MLIAVLSLGGAMLAATTIAGLLMLYQIRASTDSENSAKAIFAADTGVNWALYSFYKPPQGSVVGTLSNGATVLVICYDHTGTVTVACDDTIAKTAITKGTSLNSRRAFFLDIANATATLP